MSVAEPPVKPSDLPRIMERISRKVVKGCWVWQGTLNTSNSPVAWANGKTRGVRRLLRDLIYPMGGESNRRCDTKYCVHPDHAHKSMGEHTP